jgi:hypothetical protein
MGLILLIILVIFCFGGGFYGGGFDSPYGYVGFGLGEILIIVLIVMLVSGRL